MYIISFKFKHIFHTDEEIEVKGGRGKRGKKENVEIGSDAHDRCPLRQNKKNSHSRLKNEYETDQMCMIVIDSGSGRGQ